MKLKYIDLQGYGILVDESADIKKGWVYHKDSAIIGKCTIVGKHDITIFEKNKYAGVLLKSNCFNIIFAEKEIITKYQLEGVYILPNWREWEVERLAIEETKRNEFNSEKSFITGYNHNKAEYTKKDLRNAIEMARESYKPMGNGDEQYTYTEDEIVQSLQKLPKYIVMESEQKILAKDVGTDNFFLTPKLITNSEEGIIKEIIY